MSMDENETTKILRRELAEANGRAPIHGDVTPPAKSPEKAQALIDKLWSMNDALAAERDAALAEVERLRRILGGAA